MVSTRRVYPRKNYWVNALSVVGGYMPGPNDQEEENVDNQDSVTAFEESLEDALRDCINEDMNRQEDE
jgi:hypothetical protein